MYADGASYLGLPMKICAKCPDCGVNIEIHAHPEDSDYDITDDDIVAWYSELFGEGEDEDEDIIDMRIAFFEDSDVEYTCGCPKCGKDYLFSEELDMGEKE